MFYRLVGQRIDLPPLAQRGEDVLLLAEEFLAEKDSRKTLTAGAKELLMSHQWPGNVRELRNAVNQAYYLSEGTVIDEGDLRLMPIHEDEDRIPEVAIDEDTLQDEAQSLSLGSSERETLVRVLTKNKGNVADAAEELGLHQTTVYRKMRKHNIKTERTFD